MGEKLKSEIVKINLDEATFVGTGASVFPTCVNFFFGNNGTGKSTIAKAIQSGAGVTYADGTSRDDCETLVYNQAFIDDNMKSYHDLPGIFTFDEINSEAQAAFDRLNEELTAARKKKAAAEARKREIEKELAAKSESTMRRQYTALKPLRDRYGKLILKRLCYSKRLIPEVRKRVPVEMDEQEFQRQYDAVFGSDAQVYEEFPTTPDTSVLDHIEGSEILGIVIVNTSQTDFARFLARIDGTEWMRQSYEKYHDRTEDRCPYCYRILEPDFDKMVAECFDKQYEENIAKLNAFLEAYRSCANSLFLRISRIPEEVYPEADEKAYREQLKVLKSAIAENIELIKSKVAKPSAVVTLVDIESILERINETAERFNNLIRDSNEAYFGRRTLIPELRERLYCDMAFVLKRDFEDQETAEMILAVEAETHGKIIEKQTALISDLKEQLRGIQRGVKDTSAAMENINNMLRDAGFQGFGLRPHYDPWRSPGKKPINYEVIRTRTGKVAADLSEGEKNFIAFLYFLQTVYGSQADEDETREKIVVIDDPASGLDSGAMFIVSDRIRTLADVCRSHADNGYSAGRRGRIKQMFVFTHNAYFHREVTYPYVRSYASVSFYLVRKTENRSSVRLCEKRDPNDPAKRVNINPVKNSYAALWEEYEEAASAVPLMNAARRILETYFLRMCGYEGEILRKTILEQNKDALTRDESGSEDRAKYNIASAMLAYIDGMDDGWSYVDDDTDAKLIREVFRMIFEFMHQEQHYAMMTGLKEE